MRDNAKGGALTEVTFYILLSLYTPKHGYAVMQFVMFPFLWLSAFPAGRTSPGRRVCRI